jgi:hypothetical protein
MCVDNMEMQNMKLGKFAGQKREYLKDKIKKLKTNNGSMRDMHTFINKFRKGYQPRTDLVKDENSDLLAATQNILSR